MSPKKELSEAIGPALDGSSTTMYEMMRAASSQHPDNTAIISMHQPSDLYKEAFESTPKDEYLRWSHSQFRQQAELLALALDHLGLEKGEPIAVFLNNAVEWSLVLYSTLLLNVPFVNCNPRSAVNADEVKHVIKTSGARALVATDEKLAVQLEQAAPAELKNMKCKILVADANESPDGRNESLSAYHRLGNLLSKTKKNGKSSLSELERINREPDDTVLILFTSGTTSLPKGCEHTNETFTANMRSYMASLDVTPESVMCMNHAVNSVSGPIFNFSFLASGATVVHPSLNFDAAASIRAVEIEKCSHMGTVTTMLQLCLEHPSLSKADTTSLNVIFCGGSNVLYSHVNKCKDLTGAKLKIVYGLTESPASTNGYAKTGDGSDEHDGHTAPSTGPPAPGSKVKVCNPDTGNILERGERGELHLSGPLVIQQYIGNASPESFYVDGDQRWFRTGDEAMMDAAGEIRITGRYKDLILRGGANLSPASIEGVIGKELGLDAQVIGISDESAGEVPVAIIKAKSSEKKSLTAVRQIVTQKLGKNYALGDVVLLLDLGLEDWPKTTSGKVRKTELRDVFDSYKEATMEKGEKSDDDTTESVIREIWSQLTGIPGQEIKDDTSVGELADSLTISRLATQLNKGLGQTVSLQDLLEHPTLAEQVTLFESLKENPLAGLETTREGPPGIEDMIHTHGDEGRALTTQNLCEQALMEIGFSWSRDVKDVMPLYDWIRNDLHTEIDQVYTTKTATTQQVRQALKTALDFSDMMRAVPIRFDEDTTLFMVMRSSEKWYECCISMIPEPLDKIDDLKNCELSPIGRFGQPLVRVAVAFLHETNSAAFRINMSHMVGDGISWSLFFKDVGMSLQNSNYKPSPSIPYKLFADEKYALRHSIRAQALISKYVRTLRGIKTQMPKFWPPSTASLWNYGERWSQFSKDPPEGFTRSPSESVKSFDYAAGTSLSDREEIVLHDIRELQVTNNVPPPVLGKAALMLFAATQTQQSKVLIGEIVAGRSSWPYAAQWISQRLPSPLDIKGPAFTIMPYVLDIDENVTVMDLLKQMTKAQAQVIEDNHLSQFTLRKALNDGDPDAAKHHGDGDFMANGILRLMLDWLPAMADHNTNDTDESPMKCVHNIARTYAGAGFFMGMKPDGKTLSVGGAWIDAALTDPERKDAVSGILKMAQKLSDKKNWELKVGEVMRK